MLVIPITCDNGCPEWSMVEMQGELEGRGAFDPREDITIGKLRLSKTMPDTVELVIGYHLLEGKMVDLKKPFAILEKQQLDLGPMDADAEESALSHSTEYKVIGVVRKKCLFKTRPRAIISKPGISKKPRL